MEVVVHGALSWQTLAFRASGSTGVHGILDRGTGLLGHARRRPTRNTNGVENLTGSGVGEDLFVSTRLMTLSLHGTGLHGRRTRVGDRLHDGNETRTRRCHGTRQREHLKRPSGKLHGTGTCSRDIDGGIRSGTHKTKASGTTVGDRQQQHGTTTKTRTGRARMHMTASGEEGGRRARSGRVGRGRPEQGSGGRGARRP